MGSAEPFRLEFGGDLDLGVDEEIVVGWAASVLVGDLSLADRMGGLAAEFLAAHFGRLRFAHGPALRATALAPSAAVDQIVQIAGWWLGTTVTPSEFRRRLTWHLDHGELGSLVGRGTGRRTGRPKKTKSSGEANLLLGLDLGGCSRPNPHENHGNQTGLTR